MSFLQPFNILQEQPAKRSSSTSITTRPSLNTASNALQGNNISNQSDNVFAQQQANPSYPSIPSQHLQTTQQKPVETQSNVPDTTPLYTQFEADPASSRPIPRIQPFSASTQEILKSIGTNQNVTTGTPEWEAARERVLKSMARTVEDSSYSPVGSNSGTGFKRGRGRGRPSNLTRTDMNGFTEDGSTLNSATSTPVKRGRGGRPRGSRAARNGTLRGGRGGKRKRASSEDGDELSSLSPTPSPSSQTFAPSQPTITKSGRSITKPAPYTPLAPAGHSPTSSTPSRRTNATNTGTRGSYRRRGNLSSRDPSQALCAKCSRGHSPASNVIVFCDGCNTPWHQWCHDPHISKEVVDVAEKEWFCGECEGTREDERVPMETRVGAVELGLTQDEKEKYLALLPSVTLRKLLLRASANDAELPIFAPNTRDLLRYGSIGGGGGSRPSTLPSTHHDSAGTTENDPYPDITASASTNDPPSTYPRPGHGPIRPKPVTDEDDVEWLLEAETSVNGGRARNTEPSRVGMSEGDRVDADVDIGGGYEGFSHYYDDGNGTGGLVSVVGNSNHQADGGKKERVKGAWIQRKR